MLGILKLCKDRLGLLIHIGSHAFFLIFIVIH